MIDIAYMCRPSVVFEGGIVTGLGFWLSPATGTWLIKGGGIVELVPLTRARNDFNVRHCFWDDRVLSVILIINSCAI